MKYAAIILLLSLSSCIILPLPSHRTEGRVFIKPDMIKFIRPDTTLREEILLKLGDPDGIALNQQVFVYGWTVTQGIVAVGGMHSATVQDITQQRFFLIGFNPDNTVRKKEVFNHNIDKRKKSLHEFITEWFDTAVVRNN